MSSRFYKNEINLLLNDEETYCKEGNISENEYHQLRRKLIQKHKVKGIKASDLLINLSPKLKLSTGLLEVLEDVGNNCKVPSDYFYPNLRLIIIDNIFSIISTILSDTCQVSANPDNPVSMFSPTRKPALGINWSIFPDVELFLSFAGDVLDENGMPLLVQEFEYFNNNGLKILMKPRICELLKSRNEGEYEILTPDYYLK
nr:14365_t:CDS:2 [Entrophospora candida]